MNLSDKVINQRDVDVWVIPLDLFLMSETVL
jgi:hypothetical protein